MEEKTEQQQIKDENHSKEVQLVPEEQVHLKMEIKGMTDACEENKPEERVIPVLEENRLLDGKDGNGEEINHVIMKAEKMGKTQIDLAKKLKQGSKQSLKTKPTVPQPHTLSTERRMSKEKRGSIDLSSENMKIRKPKQRHGSMDFKNSYLQPRLLRSVSLSQKDHSSSNASETSELNHVKYVCGTSKTSSKPQVKATESVANGTAHKVQQTKDKALVKGAAESKPLKGNETKSSTFKALPLPKFYQTKDSFQKAETNKMPQKISKPCSMGQKSCPRSVPKVPESNKVEVKDKGSSKTVTTVAKETITKLLTSTRKVLNNSKAARKAIVSSA